MRAIIVHDDGPEEGRRIGFLLVRPNTYTEGDVYVRGFDRGSVGETCDVREARLFLTEHAIGHAVDRLTPVEAERFRKLGYGLLSLFAPSEPVALNLREIAEDVDGPTAEPDAGPLEDGCDLVVPANHGELCRSVTSAPIPRPGTTAVGQPFLLELRPVGPPEPIRPGETFPAEGVEAAEFGKR